MEILYFILIIGFILFQGFFAGSETAIISASKLSLKALSHDPKKAKKVKRVLRLIKDPDRVLSSLLVGTNICMVSAAALASMLFIRKYGPAGEYYSTVAITVLILIFAEILPKSIFRKVAVPVLIHTIGFIEVINFIFTPVVNIIIKTVRNMPLLRRFKREKSEALLTREDLKAVFNITAKKGVIKEFDKKILYSVFDFGATYAREIMVPLVDIHLLSHNAKVIDVIKESGKSGYTKIPIYEKKAYNIIGYVNVYDLFKAKAHESIKRYIVPALYVPETKKIDELFFEMNNKKSPIVFIVDEYGGVSGLITPENIVEEIVGEIEDDSNPAEEEIVKIAGKNEWVVDGGMDIDDLFEEVGLRLPKSGFETVAGFIEYHSGKISRKNDSFLYNNYKFIVLESTQRSIEKVKIIKIEKKKK
ncbi:MAG: HlyC/CorC family transporter [Spirochaetes bacterium]|nr:HlyC/CorC family transporter [Spirochaetota bacterium]